MPQFCYDRMRKNLHHKVLLNPSATDWVVFLHGAGGSIQTWSRQTNDFKQHFNLLLIDLRDHGKSKEILPQFDKYDFSIISNDINQLMELHQIQKAHFVTLSFGSVLLQDFSSRYADKIDKSVFAGGIFSGGLPIRLFVYLAKTLNTFLSYPVMYNIFSFLLMPRESNRVARKLYQNQAKKITQKEYMKWLGLYKEFFRLLSQFTNQKITFRSLIIMGGQDFMFLSRAKRFASAQPLVQIETIPETGHVCNIEDATHFNRKVIQFLRDE